MDHRNDDPGCTKDDNMLLLKGYQIFVFYGWKTTFNGHSPTTFLVDDGIVVDAEAAMNEQRKKPQTLVLRPGPQPKPRRKRASYSDDEYMP